ncbi:unnamed protein product [Heterosigma akashiwo]
MLLCCLTGIRGRKVLLNTIPRHRHNWNASGLSFLPKQCHIR